MMTERGEIVENGSVLGLNREEETEERERESRLFVARANDDENRIIQLQMQKVQGLLNDQGLLIRDSNDNASTRRNNDGDNHILQLEMQRLQELMNAKGLSIRDNGIVSTRRSNDDENDRMPLQMQMVQEFRNGQGSSMRDNDTASRRFHWTKFMPQTTSSVGVDGVEIDSRGYRLDNFAGHVSTLAETPVVASASERVRNGFTESERVRNVPAESERVRNVPAESERMRNVPAESERMRNVPTYVQSVGVSERHGLTRVVSGPLPEDGERVVFTDCSPRLVRAVPTRVYGGSSVRVHSDDSPPHLAREVPRRTYEGQSIRSQADNSPPHLAREVPRRTYDGRSIRSQADDSPLHLASEVPRRTYEGRSIRSQAEDSPPHLAREEPRRAYEGRAIRLLSDDYEERRRLGLCSDDGSRSLTPQSESSGQRTPFQGNPVENSQVLRQEVIHQYHPSAERLGNIGITQPARGDGYHQVIHSSAGANIRPVSNEVIQYSRAEHGPNVGSPRYLQPESRNSRDLYLNALPSGLYHQTREVQDYHGQGDTTGNNTLDYALQRPSNFGNSHQHALIEDSVHSFAHALQEEATPDHYDISRSAILEYDQGAFLQYETEAMESHENLPPEEQCDYDPNFYVIQTEDGAHVVYKNTQQAMESQDFAYLDQSDRGLKRKHGSIGKIGRSKHKTSAFVGKRLRSYDDDNAQLTVEAEEVLGPSIRSISRHGQFQTRENVGLVETEPEQFGGLSEALRSRLSKPHDSGSRDIKKRLKHPPIVHYSSMPPSFSTWKNSKQPVKPSHIFNPASVPPPYGNTKGLKKKVKAAKQTFAVQPALQDSQVSNCGDNIEKQSESSTKNVGSTKESCHLQEANPDQLYLKVKPAEKDLPEDSEEFKRQVEEWFLKFMKHLNENSGLRKRFVEQGESGRLRCIICSSYKLFTETKDVAMHAFTSPKVGFRAPHLGFHRALCILMGWDSAVVTPNGRWICQSLPDAEAWALKEDIVVWPPVVIVHSYGGNVNSNEQAKISIELLRNILKDENFDGKTKLCRGRAGSPNITVVKFTGTLSGLLEAERLHKFFAAKNHGRKELQHVTAGLSSSKDDPQVPLDHAENTLYGYLGIIEDLDKLHPDTKSHFHARSKKEILAFATADM